MQTPEEILGKQLLTIKNGVPFFDINEIESAMKEYATLQTLQLKSENQTLLDEVNRLNAHIESLEKYYNNLRHE